MPGVLSGLNHSLEIQACGRTRSSRCFELIVESVEAVLEPGAFNFNLEIPETQLEQLLVWAERPRQIAFSPCNLET